jgi:predicted MFS family arabinose efflux permease
MALNGDVESRPSLAAMLAIGVMGNSVIYVMPLLIGAMVTDRGFSEQQAGYIASADLLGYAVATLAVATLVRRVSWRSICWCGLALMAGANAITPVVGGFEAFTAVRLVSGLGGGLLAAVATVALGCRREPDRGFGALFAALLLFATAALWGLPPLIASFGLAGAYGLIALLALPVAFAVPILPSGAQTAAVAQSGASRRSRWLANLVLLSIFLFFAEQNAVWAYAERMGAAAGLSASFIGFALGVATLVSAVGAGLVAWLGARIRRGLAIALATLVQVGVFVLLAREFGPSLFLGLLALLAIAWNVVNPLQLGILSQVDDSGASLALAPAATGLGLAAGPAIGAAMLAPGDYGTLLVMCAAVAALSAMLLWSPLGSRNDVPAVDAGR